MLAMHTCMYGTTRKKRQTLHESNHHCQVLQITASWYIPVSTCTRIVMKYKNHCNFQKEKIRLILKLYYINKQKITNQCVILPAPTGSMPWPWYMNDFLAVPQISPWSWQELWWQHQSVFLVLILVTPIWWNDHPSCLEHRNMQIGLNNE